MLSFLNNKEIFVLFQKTKHKNDRQTISCTTTIPVMMFIITGYKNWHMKHALHFFSCLLQRMDICSSKEKQPNPATRRFGLCVEQRTKMK